MNFSIPYQHRFPYLLVIVFFLIGPDHSMAGGVPDSEVITGINWAWQKTGAETGNEISPPDAARYTITFNNNGSVNIQADCNWGGGKYSVEGNNITIEIDHTTRALCPPDSLDKMFVGHLNSSESFQFKENALLIKLKNNIGTMEFRE